MSEENQTTAEKITSFSVTAKNVWEVWWQWRSTVTAMARAS